ncbi:hypothetical protein QP157_00945 [Sphingomonas sp. LR61]|uniref:hypothetical protein n=1 Tax=Sphingomonas sp. LR61 TaxID=3050234 RepID=UPI002FE3C65E
MYEIVQVPLAGISWRVLRKSSSSWMFSPGVPVPLTVSTRPETDWLVMDRSAGSAIAGAAAKVTPPITIAAHAGSASAFLLQRALFIVELFFPCCMRARLF